MVNSAFTNSFDKTKFLFHSSTAVVLQFLEKLEIYFNETFSSVDYANEIQYIALSMIIFKSVLSCYHQTSQIVSNHFVSPVHVILTDKCTCGLLSLRRKMLLETRLPTMMITGSTLHDSQKIQMIYSVCKTLGVNDVHRSGI